MTAATLNGQAAAGTMAPRLATNEAIAKRMDASKRFVWVKRKLPPAVAQAVREGHPDLDDLPRAVPRLPRPRRSLYEEICGAGDRAPQEDVHRGAIRRSVESVIDYRLCESPDGLALLGRPERLAGD